MKHSKHGMLCLLALLLLCACGQRQRKFSIGVSQCSVDIWRDKFNQELRTAALISDSLTVRIEAANDDDQLQIRQINAMLDDGVDLLVVSPNQLRTISPALDRAHEEGVPVILYDRKASSKNFTAFIGCDNYQVGLSMGHYIAGQLDGTGRVVEITGLSGSSPAIERHRGFTDALKEFPGVKLVASVAGDWKEESGERAMEQIARQTDDFTYVFAHNDRMALGARKAAERLGRRHHLYTGVDALATDGGGLEKVRDHVLDASYLYPTYGNEVATLALDILTGKPFQRENYLQTSIVTADNAELILMEAKDAEQQRGNLTLLHQQVDSYMSHLHSQRLITVALVVILVLLVAITLIVYRSLLVKARLNERLAESNEKLKKLNEDVYNLTHSRLVFFTNVSHELRTPLTLILDPVERLLADHHIKGQSRDLLHIIRRNATSLQQLVNTILDLRKIQNGKMGVNATPIDLPLVVRQWVDDFGPTADRKRIRLHVETEDFTQAPVVTDRAKLAHIMFNLLSNALKYTAAEGDVFVTLSSIPGGSFLISVRDNGQGIPEGEMGKVFERFFQAKGSASGTGIGLAVVKSYTELLGGEVTVRSQEGVGTEFRIVLPCRLATPQATEGKGGDDFVPSFILPDNLAEAEPSTPADNAESEADPSCAKADKERILVIDDNADIRQYLQGLLADRFFVTQAANGREGLDKARQYVPDLVVCDVMMPVMDGLEFCKALKAGMATSHIPVIMLTAKAMDDQRAEGYELGADSYITKPFQSKVLLARIENLLRQRALLRQRFAEAKPAEKEEGGAQLRSRDRAFMQQLQDIINSHLAESDFNVESIGQEIGLSRVQLYRKVKALTGTSVVDLLRRTRLARAKHLLETTARTVSEVAYDVGFSAPSYFTKCFKEEYGMTPGECSGH